MLIIVSNTQLIQSLLIETGNRTITTIDHTLSHIKNDIFLFLVYIFAADLSSQLDIKITVNNSAYCLLEIYNKLFANYTRWVNLKLVR